MELGPGVLLGRLGRAAVLVAVAWALVPSGAAATDGGARSLVVATDRGAVRGTQTATMREFLGVPYAAAPAGDLRWRPPQPHARWSGVRAATAFGAHCPQLAGPFGIGSASEDCLFLNVFVPARPHERAPSEAPVMVWIHGGALVTGESNDYDPAALVAQGVVVVTINYRLGALGFLAHQALSGGNFGLMDQQAALRWVRRNIAMFGGDRDNVTIFGESAGGLSVHSQIVSPLAAGLFRRAIVESGAYQLTQPSLTAAEAAGATFATRTGCAAQTAACLRALPVATILANQAGTTNPTVDGVVLPTSIGPALQSGAFNHVAVLEGSNHDEWRLFVALTELATRVPLSAAAYVPAIVATLRVSPAAATAIAARYPLSAFASPSLALSAVGTDAIFACNAQTVVTAMARRVTTFQYEFDDANAPMRFLPPVSFPTGAYHAAEIQYLFDLRTPVAGPGLTPAQRQLSAAMVRYWTRFARDGSPNGSHEPVWHRADDRMRFQALTAPTPSSAMGFAAEHQCAFWSALAR